MSEKTLGSRRGQVKRVLGPGGVSVLLLIVVGLEGCARPVPRPLAGPDQPGVQAAPRASSRSDRLRDDPTRSAPAVETPTPPRAAEPAAPPAQPDQRVEPRPPVPTSEPAPPRGSEPDPAAVIDWLLNQRR